MIREGSICIWQNCVGEWEFLNGTETTVIRGLHFCDSFDYYDRYVGKYLVYGTDTPHPIDRENLLAQPHELRLKDPDEFDKHEEELESQGMLCQS